MPTLQPSSEDTRIYECAVLYPYPLGQKEEQLLLKEIEGIFAEAEAKLVFKDAWGRRGLAYSIKGFDEANIIILYYEMDPAKVKEVGNQLAILKGILRHLIVKPPKGYQIVSYAQAYEKWLQDEKAAAEREVTEKEEKKLKQVVDKAKRQSKVAAKKEAAAEEGKPAKPTGDITQQLDKMISDKDIDL